MYTIIELSPEFHKAALRSKVIIKEILSKLKLSERRVTVECNNKFFSASRTHGKLYLIREGNLVYRCQRKVLFYLDEGDLLWDDAFRNALNVEVYSDLAVEAVEYPLSDFLAGIRVDPEMFSLWHEYQDIRRLLLCGIITALSKSDLIENPNIQTFEAGNTIIEQGSVVTEVYTLIEGHAEVLVDGVRVGEILQDELFGALGGLTGTPRTASVVATAKSIVLALKKEEFVQLIEARPCMIQEMVKDMARAIVDLNKKVIGFRHKLV